MKRAGRTDVERECLQLRARSPCKCACHSTANEISSCHNSDSEVRRRCVCSRCCSVIYVSFIFFLFLVSVSVIFFSFSFVFVFNRSLLKHVLAIGCPSVRLSVCLSHVGIVSKRLNLSSNCLHCLVAP